MLRTDRLRLVPHHPSHFDAYAAFWAKDPSIFLCHLADMRPEDIWTRLLKYYGLWTAFGYGPFLGFDENDVLVAEIGFVDYHRAVAPRFDGVPEAMWKIDIDHHGKGLANEAMSAIAPWFDARRIATRSVCMIDPGNEASIHVARRFGFAEFDRVLYRETPVILFERIT